MGSWDLNLRTQELTWSDAARELFGVSDSVQVSYDLFLSLLESDDRKRTEHAIREAVENGRSFDLSYSLRKPSGSTHWVRARGAVIREPGGSQQYLSGILFDVDEEKQLEQSLRMREEHLKSILETVPEAMIVIDGNGIMQFFSSAAERQFGYLEHEVTGKNVSMLMLNP